MKYCKNCLQPDTRPGVVFIVGRANFENLKNH